MYDPLKIVLVKRSKKTYSCDRCGGIIEPGMSYSWVTSKKFPSGYEFRCSSPQCSFDIEIPGETISVSSAAPSPKTPEPTKPQILDPKLQSKIRRLSESVISWEDGLTSLGLKRESRFVSGTHPKIPKVRLYHRVYSFGGLIESGWTPQRVIEDFGKEIPTAPLWFCFRGQPETGYMTLWLGPIEPIPFAGIILDDIGEETKPESSDSNL